MMIKRRTFVKSAGIASLSPSLLTTSINTISIAQDDEPLSVHLFSKHLQFLDVKAAGQIAAELGFDGLDLTVRPKGHILPEDVKTHLAKAVQAIEQAGGSCQMITTAVSDISNPLDKDVIQAAAKAGIQYYRSNWFSYKEELSLEDSLDYYKEKIRQLGAQNKKSNIIGC